MDKLTAMTVFARVAESESFTAAANELGISKAAASKMVAGLEDHLGVRLINRTTRRLNLTEVGSAYLERTVRILSDLEEADAQAGSLNAEPRGTLRISAPMTFGTKHLAPHIGAFITRHPRLSVDLDLSDRIVDVIDEGYDLAIRIAKLSDSSLIAQKLAPVRMLVCASPEYWRNAPTVERPEDLKDHNCLLYAYTPPEWRFETPDGPVAVKVSGNFRTNNGEALRAAACDGLGVILEPDFIVGQSIQSGRLVSTLDGYPIPSSAVHAVYPPGRHLSAKVRAFIAFVKESIGRHPYWGVPENNTP